MGRQHLCDMAQDPVDLLLLAGCVLAGRLTAALGGTRFGANRQTPERDADPAEQQKRQQRSFAGNQGPQRAERFVRNKGPQRGQRDGAKGDCGQSVGRVHSRSEELHNFHDRADLVGESAPEKRVARRASSRRLTRGTIPHMAWRIRADL
jgi:hypothetical protein